MPDVFPQPESEAPMKYVRVFMRALGIEPMQHHTPITHSAAGD
jgi:hypothetical protein